MGKVFKVKIDGETFFVEIEEIGQKPAIKNIESVKAEKPAFEEKVEEKLEGKKETPAAVPVDVPYGNGSPEKVEKPLGDFITSPLPGKIISINVKQGQKIKRGDLLLVLEAMKMENEVFASHEATVKEIYAKAGDTVETNARLIRLER